MLAEVREESKCTRLEDEPIQTISNDPQSEKEEVQTEAITRAECSVKDAT